MRVISIDFDDGGADGNSLTDRLQFSGLELQKLHKT